MIQRSVLTSLVCLLALASGGCGGMLGTAVRVGKNLSTTDSYLKISLDGQVAAQNQFEKATGHSKFKVAEPVGTSPRLKFEIVDPDRFGRITMVSVQIHQKHQADYSHLAEFTIFAANTNDPQSQMKPNTEYALGSPGSDFKVTNYKNETVGGVTLTPGVDYMLVLTVRADKSETAQIYFKTK
jgi:hypothetical protein